MEHSWIISPVTDSIRPQANEIVRVERGGPMIVSCGRLLDASVEPGFVCLEDGQILGLLLYNIEGEDCEITALISYREGAGIGAALVDAARSAADAAGCRRLWLITTNDNTPAIRWYQKRGFSLKAVHLNALDRARELRAGIPLTGRDGIPLLHEFEFELPLR